MRKSSSLLLLSFLAACNSQDPSPCEKAGACADLAVPADQSAAEDQRAPEDLRGGGEDQRGGGEDLRGGGEDQRAPEDLRAPDLRGPEDLAPADLGPPRTCGISCGCVTGAPMGGVYQFVTNTLKLPSAMTPFASDLDGDGRPDNQLKAILGALVAAGFSLDAALDEAVRRGDGVLLLDAQAADLTMGCLHLAALRAQTPVGAPPRYDGTDVFGKVLPAANLFGELTAGKLATVPSRYLQGAEVSRLGLKLPFLGATPVPLYGLHVQGAVTASNVMSGELHGVILKSDIDAVVIPNIAQALTDAIHANPMSSTTETIIRLFEDPMGNPVSQRKCMVARDCCQLPANRPTCKILPEEVSSNALVRAVLAPDVQVMQGGVWKPLPGGAMKDALSLGIGFTAVKASF